MSIFLLILNIFVLLSSIYKICIAEEKLGWFCSICGWTGALVLLCGTSFS